MGRRNIIIIGLFASCIAMFAGLVMISNQVQEKQIELAHIQDEMDELKQDTKALKAEWSYLTRPQRLEALTSGRDPDHGQKVVP